MHVDERRVEVESGTRGLEDRLPRHPGVEERTVAGGPLVRQAGDLLRGEQLLPERPPGDVPRRALDIDTHLHAASERHDHEPGRARHREAKLGLGLRHARLAVLSHQDDLVGGNA